VPGKRNLARERAAHDARAAQARVFAMLCAVLPTYDRALIGAPAVLNYLGQTLSLTRPNGSPLRWRMVLRWRRDFGFPLLRGGWNPRRRCLAMPLTSTHAVTAWTLAQFDSASHSRWLFAVGTPAGSARVGKALRGSAPERIARMDRAQTAA
jgi:hypothetical protein